MSTIADQPPEAESSSSPGTSSTTDGPNRWKPPSSSRQSKLPLQPIECYNIIKVKPTLLLPKKTERKRKNLENFDPSPNVTEINSDKMRQFCKDLLDDKKVCRVQSVLSFKYC